MQAFPMTWTAAGSAAEERAPVERPVSGNEATPEDVARIFLEDLFARHHAEIYGYLVRMLRDPDLAADLTQDAFLKAYRAHDTLKDPDHARAWLYQIARRVALDELRHRRVIRIVPWTGESYGVEPSAEQVVMETSRSGDLRRALEEIPERQRAALLLSELHDLSGLELASALGVSHVAARALLTRGRKALRRALASQDQADADAATAGATGGQGDDVDGELRLLRLR